MNNIKQAYHIISKLDFNNLEVNTKPSTILDNNKSVNIVWTVGDPTNGLIKESNGVKILSFSSNNYKIYTSLPFNTNIKNDSIQFEANILIPNIKTNNIFFNIGSSTSTGFRFNIKNTFIGAFEIFFNNKSIIFNYNFLSNVKYHILVTKVYNVYSFYINGLIVGSCTSNDFNNNITLSGTSLNLTIGAKSATNTNAVDEFNGEISNVNISISPSSEYLKYYNSFTKYGDNLVSRLNFGNLAFNSNGSTTTFTPDLEAVAGKKMVWTYGNLIINNDYATLNGNPFTSSISNLNTLFFNIKNKNVKYDGIELLSLNDNYKIIYNANYQGEPEPNVIVNACTTSALNFENNLNDNIETTVWLKEGISDITKNNVIYGENSFETKNLGDSLYTNSNIITGGNVPFTVEFYMLYKNKYIYDNNDWDAPVFTRYENGDIGNYLNTNTYNISYHSVQQGLNTNEIFGKNKFKPNEINKFTMTYDGSCIRTFINDKLDNILGSNIGFYKNTNDSPFRLFSRESTLGENSTLVGIIDNINIHDGISTKVREYDQYEDYLIVDLPFDGENNSTTIVDNAYDYSSIEDKYNNFVVSLLHFDESLVADECGNTWVAKGNSALANTGYFGDSSFYSDGSNNSCIYMSSTIPKLNNSDFCIEFFYKSTNNSVNRAFFSTYGYSDTSERNLHISSSDGKLNATFILNPINNDIELNTWYHIAYTRQGSTFRLFLNGVLVGTGTSNDSIVTTGYFLAIQPYNTTWVRSGYYDEFRLTIGVPRYTSNFNIPTKKYSYTKINKWSVSGNAKISTDKKFDGYSSLYLENNSSVILNKSIIFETYEDFTISFDLYRLENSNSYTIIFSPSNANNGKTFAVCLNGDNYPNTQYSFLKNKLYFSDESQNTNIKLFYSNTNIPYNKITKVGIMRKNGTMYLYINDILEKTTLEFKDLIIDLGNIKFGDSYAMTNTSFKGYIKNFKIYKGVAVMPESNAGKIQLEFDNNLNDKYGNSTWTNDGVTFDQVNSVKGYSAYFGNNQKLSSGVNSNLNFDNKNFLLSFDGKALSGRGIYSELLSSGQSTWSNGCLSLGWHGGTGTLRLSNYFNNVDTNIGSIYLPNDSFYNINFCRNSFSMHTVVNDVLVNTYNLEPNMKFNFNDNNNTFIGNALWSGNNGGFKGYIDNFKSYKEDLINNNIAIYSDPSVNISYEVSKESMYVYGSGDVSSTNGTSIVNLLDSPILKDFIAEVEIYFDSSTPYIYGGLIFRTLNYGIRTPQLGYLIYLTTSNNKTNLRFGKGTNSSTDSWSQIHTVDVDSYRNGTYRVLKVVANNSTISAYIDNILIFSVEDKTHNISSNFGLNVMNYFNTAMTSRTKRVDIWDINENHLYHKDWKSKIKNEIEIVKPAVHLPLETNAINIGFSNLTVNSVGSPTYTVVDGKKCIKFERNKYINISNANIFNLGENSDFYFEVDLYYISVVNPSSSANIIRCAGTWNANLYSCIQISTQDVLLYSKGFNIKTSLKLKIGEFNNLKLFRNGNKTTLELNGEIQEFYNLDFNFTSDTGVDIGGIGILPDNYFNGYMSNFKLFVGVSEIPNSYNKYKVLNLDFKPTGKSYLFKDNNNKCIIHPVNILQRDYQDSKYCCSFNGSSQHLELGKNELLNFGLDDCVIEIIFKPKTQSAEWGSLIAHSMTSATSMDFIMVTRNGTIECRVNNVALTTNTDIKVIYNEVNKLLFIRNNKNITLILNDVIIYNANCEEPFSLNKNNNTYIGKNGWDNTNGYFCGIIYSIKVLRNTSDLSLLEEEEIIYQSDEKFILTNGEEAEEIEFTEIKERNIKVISDNDKITLKVDENEVEVSKTNEVDNIKLFDGYTSQVKDIRVYDIVMYDDDEFIGSELIDTPYPELEFYDENDIQEIQVLDVGEYIIKGFIEGDIDRKYIIRNKYENFDLCKGSGDYYYDGIDERYIDDYEIYELDSKQRYQLYNHEMKKGYISGTVNLANCKVKRSNMKVYCYRNDNNRLIGIYDLDENNKYIINNLDVNSKYDIIFKDQSRKIENISSSYRTPKEY